MNRVILYVLGVCCVEKIQSIEHSVKSLKGITSFKGSLPKGKLVVEFRPSQVQTAEIIDQIEERGFAVLKNVKEEYVFDTYN
jgi:copper chaperone CopZ